MTLEILIALVIGGLILLRLAYMFDRACKRLDQIEEHLRPAKRFERVK